MEIQSQNIPQYIYLVAKYVLKNNKEIQITRVWWQAVRTQPWERDPAKIVEYTILNKHNIQRSITEMASDNKK